MDLLTYLRPLRALVAVVQTGSSQLAATQLEQPTGIEPAITVVERGGADAAVTTDSGEMAATVI